MLFEAATDISQWLAINEETLFLHDGILRITDLIELPKNAVCATEQELEQEVINFDTKSPVELTHRMLGICGSKNNTYARLLEYRLNAILGLWKAHHILAIEQSGRISSINNEETVALLKQQGLLQQAGEHDSFSSRVSLLLVYPLLQSQSRLDPSLCGHTTSLLFNCLQDCPPLSLSKEPVDCLNGLESLLCGWLGETKNTSQNETSRIDVENAQIQNPRDRENAASALVALACARGSMKTFIHTIHLLQKLPEVSGLPVAIILNKLLDLQGGFGYPSALLGTKHILCWGFEDMLTNTAGSNAETNVSDRDFDSGRSITCDDKFIYTTNSFGIGVAKIGNGLNGSLRGYVYSTNTTIGPGWLAMVDGKLLFRHHVYDDQLTNMADVLNPSTLKFEGKLKRPDDKLSEDVSKSSVTTIQFCSDGKYLYWIWCLPVNDKPIKGGAPVYVNVYQMKEGGSELSALRVKVLLQKKDESSTKNVNESLMAKLRPFRSSAAAQHASANLGLSSGAASSNSSSQETTSLSSCGIPLKSLLRVPIYTCGSAIVIVTTVIGSSNTTSRSLFGSGSTLSGLRALATNLTFSLTDGQFMARNDLTDAPTSSLARGAPLHSLGICYDYHNNMIWTCSSDYIDQYLNPGHQAVHHIHKHMQIQSSVKITENKLSPAEVIRVLLQHVGSMCCHHLSCDFLQTPLGTLLLQQQQPLDLSHFIRVLDILEMATRASDEKIICCALIILQVIFKTFVFGKDSAEQHKLMNRLSSMVWLLLSPGAYKFQPDPPGSSCYYGIQAEACKVITSGIDILYPSSNDKRNLISSLINNDGEDHQPRKYLRNLILCDLADALQNSQNPEEDANTLCDNAMDSELIGLLLELSVDEWSRTLNKLCSSKDRLTFDLKILNSPVCSPCLRYLGAYQNYLLKKAVLHASNFQDGKMTGFPSKGCLQSAIKIYTELVFKCSSRILQLLHRTYTDIFSAPFSAEDHRLQGIERLAKSSVIGYLLPLLVTCLTHENIRCLSFSESSLMPKLVKLVISTSQVLYLLKSSTSNYYNNQVALHKKDDDFVQDLEILSGLKIPAPWATGKVIESIHPVRDNYRFKETVQIPGARCLYLRFDPRCSSQYDYDKLIIYAGPNTSHRKLAEFGGNTIGYGSRSVLGSGWPKDLLKVEGDAVTFSFEMRSGREHNTPDKALWGFLVTVRAQENTQDICVGLPFIPDLILMLSTLMCDMLKLLYEGCEVTEDEKACEHLLQSTLLQRCLWQRFEDKDNYVLPVDSNVANPIKNGQIDEEKSEDLHPYIINPLTYNVTKHFLLSRKQLQQLRSISGQIAPQFRPSIRDVIKPELMESRIVSAIVKHMSLQDTVAELPKLSDSKDSEKYKLLKIIVTEVYKKTDALIRRLQILSELEQKWYTELEDIRKGLMPAYMSFFAMHHLMESQAKEVSLLCCLKDVAFDPNNLEAVVNSLREKMETEAGSDSDDPSVGNESMPKTRKIVATMLERAELLLYVNINCDKSKMTQIQVPTINIDKSDSVGPSILPRSVYSRSLSAPSQLWDHDIAELTSPTTIAGKRMSLSLRDSDSVMDDVLHSKDYKMTDNENLNFHLLDQIFLFIGKLLNKNVPCETFLSAVATRIKRARTRCQALVQMKELLTAASEVNCAAHLITAITSILQNGAKIEEFTCSGLVREVNEAFADTMMCVVKVAASNPFACYNGIGLLCTIPFTRSEEQCLVNSGLVQLLDRLCSLSNYRGDAGLSSGNADKQSIQQKVSALAWAGFQVLSNRCVMWETDSDANSELYTEKFEHAGLASQVATLLTNHLARATESSASETAGNEMLQEVLSLLNNLSRSHLGRAILSQSTCVSKLLSLLVDHCPSPKLVLVILQLCRFALPLMTAEDCDKVTLPDWNCRVVETPDSPMDTASKIVRLLVSKLGDFLVPGFQTSLSRRPSRSKTINKYTESEMTLEYIEELMFEEGQVSNDEVVEGSQEHFLSVFLHKREDQSAHEVIQLLLSGTDGHLFRLNGNTNLERIVLIDKEMTKNGKAEVCTEPVRSALRKSAKWASLGLVLSTAIPVDGGLSLDEVGSDKKKSASETYCKEKNFELSKMDPLRPFISGNVANSMASEIINLLHSLLAQTSQLQLKNSQFWASAIINVLNVALSELPKLLKYADSDSLSQSNLLSLMIKAKQVLASLNILGGFKETIKPGSDVIVTGPGVKESHGQVVSVSESEGIAMVKMMFPTDGQLYPRASDIVEVSISRLSSTKAMVFSLENTTLCEPLVSALQVMLSSNGSLFSSLANYKGSNLAMAVARVFAEIQTRASIVLKQYLHYDYFVYAFIKDSPSAVDMLKNMAKECVSGNRLSQVESNCQRLQMLYRDCARPPAPPSKSHRKSSDIMWNISKLFPPVRSCLFTNGDCGITFLGDPSVSSGLPRGTVLYATKPLQLRAPSFYWEVEICSFGDSQEDNGPVVSFGFAPAAEKRDGAWTNPVGTILFHNNGRAVHYNGSSLLQWKSVRLNISLSPGDFVGVGWERTSENESSNPNDVKGIVFFTINGIRLPAVLDDVCGGMWPIAHIQKKNTRIKANFGCQQFKYSKGHEYRFCISKAVDAIDEMDTDFDILPFHSLMDIEGDDGAGQSNTDSNTPEVTEPTDGLPCIIPSNPKSRKEYNVENCLLYKHRLCFNKLLTIGPDPHVQKSKEEDESDGEDDTLQEDYHSLLVKAWEVKVFPIIRRRFRNEAERKDGLEQIRGALQLGMTDIARQTVEFLYEENGGMPRDLYLPTIEDMKEEASKFTISQIAKGTVVMIRDHTTLHNTNATTTGATLLPKFAVHSMLKTFGLIGVVLEVDMQHELIQIETYLQSEGVLVRYWYPVEAVERTAHSSRRPAIIGSQTIDTRNILIHKELIRCEHELARMYCRSALLQLISFCNRSDICESLDCFSAVAHSSTMASCAALLQELDIENLQLLSDECLASATLHGNAVETNINTCNSPHQCLASLSCSPTDLFYSNSDRLSAELSSAIKRAACQGEGCLIELTNQICMSLQLAPEGFLSEEIVIGKDNLASNVYFPRASFIIVSCRAEGNSRSKRPIWHKTLFARVYCYSGLKVKKDGSMSKREVMYYPYDSSSTCMNTASGFMSDHYPSILLPCDRVFVKCGVSTPPGIVLCLNGIPPQLPLALSFIEQLLLFKHQELKEIAGKYSDEESCCIPEAVTVGVLLNVVELLCGYILRTEIPVLLKEKVFHLLAEVLRTLHLTAACSHKYSQGSQDDQQVFFPSTMPLSSQFGLSLSILTQLQTELKHLYREETKQWSPGPGGLYENGIFTSYFQALMEVCMAISEVTTPSSFAPLPALSSISSTTNPDSGSFSLGSLMSSLVGDYAQAASNGLLSVTLNAPPSPALSKRKKLKAKREGDKSSQKSHSGSSSPRSSDIEVHANGNVAGSCLSPGKPEDSAWFQKAVTISQILRYLVLNDTQGMQLVDKVICESCQELAVSTTHSRLLVIKGIPKYITQDQAKQAIKKSLRSCGGLYCDEIYIPTAVRTHLSDSDDTSEQRHIKGHGVLELRLSSKAESAIAALYKNTTYFCDLSDEAHLPVDEIINLCEDYQICTVDQSLQTSESRLQHILDEYLHQKLISQDGELADNALIALTEIFHSCFIAEHRLSLSDPKHESGYICLSKEQITNQVQGNLFYTFLNSLKATKQPFNEMVSQMLSNYGIIKHLEKEMMMEEGEGSPIATTTEEKVAKEPRQALSMAGQKPLVKKSKSSKKASADVFSKENVPCSATFTENACNHYLTLNGFMQFVLHKAEDDSTTVWLAILACGYDIHCDRCCCIDDGQAIQMSRLWNIDMDSVLTDYVNVLCRKVSVTPAAIHPHEIYFSKSELASPEYFILQDLPIESMRIRFRFLQTLNSSLESHFLPLIDMQASTTHSHNTASMLSAIRGLIFYSSKVTLFSRVLNVTALRRSDQAAPEVILNPLEIIGCELRDVLKTQFCQAIRQLHQVPSSQLCVKPASGSDPMYAFNIRFTGEKVLGTSGSFRHFLSQVSKELQGPLLDLFVLCPSSSANRNKGKYMLKPGPMTFNEEQLLIALGQLFGITIRAEIPLPMDFLSVFWKTLIDVAVDEVADLQDADLITYNYIKQFNHITKAGDLDRLLDDYHRPTFTYTTLSGRFIELCPNGSHKYVNWSNYKEYANEIKRLRLSELRNSDRVAAIKAGLASIVYLPMLTIMSPLDMEMRTCGIPDVDIDFLKAHTIYQSGLMETDDHVQYFWNALESFSPDELRKFIKFACNQDRIPMTCPCLSKPLTSATSQDGSNQSETNNTVVGHVPPYPMKIAPPDAQPGHSANKRFIRVETCLFMIKIPQYTTQEALVEKLLFAIHCRDDPLSG